MSQMKLDDLELEKVKFQVGDDEGNLSIRIIGDIDMEDPSEKLTPYLLECHDKLVAASVKKLNLDFTNLSFMNSGGIRSFVIWFMKLGQVPENEKYEIKLIYSSSITWQESSLPVLQMLQPSHISIEPV